MKRRGHVAGRRRSHCLCDPVQIHPTLKRRMCTKRKVGESRAAQSFPQLLRCKISTRWQTHTTTSEDKSCGEKFSFVLGGNQMSRPPSVAAVSARCAALSVRRGEKLLLAVTESKPRLSNPHRRPTHQLRLSSTGRAAPPTKPARCKKKKKNPPKQEFQS